MRLFHYLVIASLAPVLADCSIHPLVDDVTRETTADIVRHIRCEARQAVLDYDIRSANAPAGTNTTLAIAYEFTFQITENNNAKADITAEIPFLTKGSSFTLLANADSEQQRFSKRNFRILDTFDELRNADYCSPKALESNLTYPIAGEIGIYEVVTTFARLSRVAELKKTPFSSQPKPGPAEPLNKVVFRFADTLTFTTTLSGGVTPTLTLSPLTNRFRVTKVNQGPLLKPGLNPGVSKSELSPLADNGLNVRREDVHQVVIAMAGVPKTIDLRRSNDNIRPPLSPNSITSTTEYQLQATAKERALFELDRQRMLTLQQQSPNLLLGGP
jgi:hypothetical protein